MHPRQMNDAVNTSRCLSSDLQETPVENNDNVYSRLNVDTCRYLQTNNATERQR